MYKFFNWLISKGHVKYIPKSVADELLISMRMTAKCRYNAANRLQVQSKFAFFTTTVFSLGLVFIPLIQNSGVQLAMKPNVLNMMQIFLGVAVLVYSVVIGTARYDQRAELLRKVCTTPAAAGVERQTFTQ